MAGDSWRITLSAWAADGHEYAKDLAYSAKTYADVEQTNTSGFSNFHEFLSVEAAFVALPAS